MKGRTLVSTFAALLVLALPFILGSCVIAGTGTIHVVNWLSSGDITSLYIYPQGQPDTRDEIGNTLHKNDFHEEIGLKPGPYTIHAVIDYGAAAAEEYVTVEEGVVHIVPIGDGDII